MTHLSLLLELQIGRLLYPVCGSNTMLCVAAVEMSAVIIFAFFIMVMYIWVFK